MLIDFEQVEIALKRADADVVSLALDDILAVFRNVIGLVLGGAVEGQMYIDVVESIQRGRWFRVVDFDGDLRNPQFGVAQVRLERGFVERGLSGSRGLRRPEASP